MQEHKHAPLQPSPAALQLTAVEVAAFSIVTKTEQTTRRTIIMADAAAFFANKKKKKKAFKFNANKIDAASVETKVHV